MNVIFLAKTIGQRYSKRLALQIVCMFIAMLCIAISLEERSSYCSIYLNDKKSNVLLDGVANLGLGPRYHSGDERVMHLFTHGQPGALLIEGHWKNPKEIAKWLKSNDHLSNKSHLNIYGCEFAKGEKGKQAVSYLEGVLDVSIAASDDVTGIDGDWDLEVGNSVSAIQVPNYTANLQTRNCPGMTYTVYEYHDTSSVNVNSAHFLTTSGVPAINTYVDQKTYDDVTLNYSGRDWTPIATGVTFGSTNEIRVKLNRATSSSTAGTDQIIADAMLFVDELGNKYIIDDADAAVTSNVNFSNVTANAASYSGSHHNVSWGAGGVRNFNWRFFKSNTVLLPDLDGDDVADHCDLDDDNDGILDTEETVCASPIGLSPSTLGLSAGSGQTGSVDISSLFGYSTGSFILNYTNANVFGGTFHVSRTTDSHFEIISPLGHEFEMILLHGRIITRNSPTIDYFISNSGMVFNFENQADLISGFFYTNDVNRYIVTRPSSSTSNQGTSPANPFTFVSNHKSSYYNFAAGTSDFGAGRVGIGFAVCGPPDTDGDGIPDYKDLDSDNDGCPDALESNNNPYTWADLNPDGSIMTTLYPIDPDGLPDGSSYDNGSSKDPDVLAPLCDPCDSTSPFFTDNDNDNIGDECDLDDDNDGILDTDEGSCNIGTTGTWTELSSGVWESPISSNLKVKVSVSDYTTYWDALPMKNDTDGSCTGASSASGNVNGKNGLYMILGGQINTSQPAVPTTSLTVEYLDASNNPVKVHNPIMHVLGLGGVSGGLNSSSEWKLGNGGSIDLISGVNDFTVLNNKTIIRNSIGGTPTGGTTTCGTGESSGTVKILGYLSKYKFDVRNINGSNNVDYVNSADKFILLFEDCVGALDTDDDGIPNHFDLDSDNDGVYDLDEAGHNGADVDENGIIDGALSTFGTNGFHDSVETSPDNGISNYTISDSESTPDGTYDPYETDADGDGCYDAEEESVSDPDDDGIAGTGVPTVAPNGLVNGITYGSPPNNFWQNPIVGPCLPEICNDTIDNDGDGVADCLDGDCGLLNISTVVVGSCIDDPLADRATLDVTVEWNAAYTNDTIEVSIYRKTEYVDIDILSSPQTVSFNIPADSSVGDSVIVTWSSASNPCIDFELFDAPAPCSNDSIMCSILYLCSFDKPYDGDSWDHGWLEYLDGINGNSLLTPVATKNEPGLGLYDPMDTTMVAVVDFDDYDIIIISATTEFHISSDLVDTLKNLKSSILNSNQDIYVAMGYSTYTNVAFQEYLYIDDTNTLGIYNFNNVDGIGSPVFTGGDVLTGGDDYLWMYGGGPSTNDHGVFVEYEANDNLPIVGYNHGKRVLFGYHMNGVYGNYVNGGLTPVPVSGYFDPIRQLTGTGKIFFDQAILSVSNCDVSCKTATMNPHILYYRRKF